MSETVLIAIACVLAGLAGGALIAWLMRPRAAEPDRAAELAFSNLNTRLDDMAKWLHGAHGNLQNTVNQQLAATTKNTADHLQQLHARLAVMDGAQKTMMELASQVTSLNTVLASKQQRGAFGQSRMEIIIQDGLPKDCYSFQKTLSTGDRPDCCVLMPDSPQLVIDAKFPLEAVTLYREAKTDEERKIASARVRNDVGKHVTEIAKKYLIPGETHDLALMFVPSESIYADLYDGFDDVFQKAYRAKVIIVSPSLLMLAVQVIQQIRKDARMREAAGKIIAEVGILIGDVGRLKDRVEALDKHFGQANADIRQIVISADKIVSRGEKIQDVEFGGEPPAAQIIPGPGARKLEAGE